MDVLTGMDIQIGGYNLLNEDHGDLDPSGFMHNDFPHPGITFAGRISYSF